MILEYILSIGVQAIPAMRTDEPSLEQRKYLNHGDTDSIGTTILHP